MSKQAKFEIDRKEYPFRSRWVSLKNGAAIHYVDEGKGPTLLFLHGNPTWSYLYRNIIVGLKNQFRCIAPDYPGFGLSTPPSRYGFTAAEHADVMAQFVEKLILRDVTIFMQDWGGPIGFSVALRFPERVHGFIIGNSWAWPLERLGPKTFSLVMGGAIGRLITRCCNGVVRFFMKMGVVTPLKKQTFQMYLAPFQNQTDRPPTHIFPRQLRAANPFLAEVYSGLPLISQKPALIVWGDKDFAFKKPERSRFESIFPKHTTVLLQNAGHFIQEDAPGEIIEAIRKWMKKIRS
jgi:haloalkane dehalogenase